MLRILVILSATFALAALTLQVIRTFSFGKKPVYSRAQGSATKGILYAFGQGMMPWEKESTAKHLPTYFAGVLYHLGVIASFIALFTSLIQIMVPHGFIYFLRITLMLGIASGIGLMAKRVSLNYMRAISCADDFVSNSLVTLFSVSALLALFRVSLIPMFHGASIILFLYIPFGKIRHCIFFFYSRILFGQFFGRRGVLPHRSSEA